MKLLLLLLLLLSFSAIAQHRLLFKPIDNSLATQFLQEGTEAKVIKKAVKVLRKSRAIKGKWVTNAPSVIQRTIQDIVGHDINQGFESTTHTFELEDITAEIAAQNALKTLNKYISCGSNIVKLITIRNSVKSLNPTQVLEILQTYSDTKALMESGSLVSAKALVPALVVDGVKITETDKTFVIAEIDKCLE